jgi:folate-binding protein YgfZ
MTEAVEQIAIRESPLQEAHVSHGASMSERDGWSVPLSYGDRLFEYAAVRERGAGLIDLSSRGRIVVSGTEAITFLNGLITNDMKTLGVNSSMAAAFPNVQGRLIAAVRVIRLNDQTGKNAGPAFLIDTEAVTHERVFKTIERFTLAGDFRVNDITNQTVQLSVQGTQAVNLIRSVFSEEVGGLAPNAASALTWQGSEITVVRATHRAADGFDLIANSKQARDLWDALHGAGARPVGYVAMDILRIEAGVPRYGVDMDDSNVVTEAALDEAVSYTKGCYVGQEIIARIKYRGHVAKKLSGLVSDQPAGIAAGAAIKSLEGKEVGRITSVTDSPHLGRTIALGYLKYDYIAAGTRVKIVSAAEDIPAQVTSIPFVGVGQSKE